MEKLVVDSDQRVGLTSPPELRPGRTWIAGAGAWPITLAGVGFLPFLLRLGEEWSAALDPTALEGLLPGILVGPLVVVLLIRAGATSRQEPADTAAAQPTGPTKLANRLALGLALLTGGLALATGLTDHAFWGSLLLPGWASAFIWAWWGPRALRRRLVPLLLLVCLPPLPQPLLAVVQPQLSLLGARFAQLIGLAAGLPATRLGNVVETPRFYIEVVDSCSGFYMALMFLIISLTLLQLRGWSGWRGWSVVALAIPLGLLLNGARLGALLLMGQDHPELAQTSAGHDAPGLLLFVLGVVLLQVTGEVLARRRSAQKR